MVKMDLCEDGKMVKMDCVTMGNGWMNGEDG